MRWIWIDRFVELRTGQFAKAIKNISRAEDHLRDHFPGYPIMPGSLIIEGMAQTGGILVGEAQDFKNMVVLAKLSRVEFCDRALPGDQLTYEARLVEMRDEGAVVETKAFVNDRPLASAEIVFGHVDRPEGWNAPMGRYGSFKQELMDTLGLPRHSAPEAASNSSSPSPGTATAP